jgi:hypothetical protein
MGLVCMGRKNGRRIYVSSIIAKGNQILFLLCLAVFPTVMYLMCLVSRLHGFFCRELICRRATE